MNSGFYSSAEARRVARVAWLAIAAQLLFVAAWVVAGALQDGYSHADQYVSELGAKTADNPWIVNSALVLIGLSTIGLGAGLFEALPRRRFALLAVALFVLAGLAWVLAGAFRLDCAISIDPVCEMRFDDGDLSTATYVHAGAAGGVRVLLLLTPFAIAAALWPRPLARLLLALGALGLAIFAGFACFWLIGETETGEGAVQRVGQGVVQGWLGLVALGLLVWAGGRRASSPDQGARGPLEPRPQADNFTLGRP